jgi:hypothetical protein
MAVLSCASGGEGEDKMREFLGPSQVDQAIRHAMQMCWMMLPAEKKNLEEVKRQIQRLVDRALRDAEEDREAFGLK